jgi:hypothetical protein
MAYALSNPVRRVGPQNSGSPVLWVYADGDNLAAIDASGYFNLSSDSLQVGDFIFIAAADGYGIAVVNANSSGVVDTTNATAVGTIDSD